MPSNKALQLSSHSSCNRSVVVFGIERWRFDRATEALWLAAERPVRWTAREICYRGHIPQGDTREPGPGSPKGVRCDISSEASPQF